MKFLKQGVCLALLAAGLSAAPVSLAADASAPAPAAAPSAKTIGTGLVSQVRAQARGSVVSTAFGATGMTGMLKAGLNGDLMPSVSGEGRAAAAAKSDDFVAQFGGVFGAAGDQLARTTTVSDGYDGWTSTYTQTYEGLPVFGSRVMTHVDDNGDLTGVSGFAAPDIDLSATPRITQSDAAARALALVKTSPAMAANGGTALASDLKVVSNQLEVYRSGVTKGIAGDNHLAYVSEVRDDKAVREQVVLDAETGKLLNRWSMMDQALNRKLYERSYDPANPAANLVYSEGQALPTDPDQRDEVVTSGESYYFFQDVFGRDSYDGKGATRITVNNDPTISCPNANWNGTTTNYCTGVSSDDVVAHEWGHAYTEYTDGLIYQWQSGALNESFSDVWGETLDLINGRDDENEGDLNAKRPVGLCSANTRSTVELNVTQPASIGHCDAAPASFGPVIDTTGFTDTVVVATDPADTAGPSTTDGCTAFTNAAAVNGNFAYVDRGTCAFADKIANAVAAGASGIIFGNNSAAVPSSVAGQASIPGLMITQAKGTEIKAAAATGPVTATMRSIDTRAKANSFRWLLSEKSTAFGGAIRDMWTPNCYGDPGKVSDVQYQCDTSDGGGVHSNSGVPNHAYALTVDGGTDNGQTVRGIGLTKAAHIWWQAQTTYLTPVSGFPEMANAIEASCSDLIGKKLTALDFQPNGHGVYDQTITANDCAQVAKVSLATELRTPATQCDFKPLLDPNTPAGCGAGTAVKSGGYVENFEDGLTGWDTTSPAPRYTGGINANWQTSTELPSGNLPAGDTSAAFGPAPDRGTCNGAAGDFSSVNYLTSPAITVGATGDVANSARLSFTHNVQTELGFDGGTVYISVNGGAFNLVPAAAYTFNAPSTLATAASGNTDPLAGRAGFTGTDGGKIQSDWGTSTINLPTVGVNLGDSIKVRFAVGRDGCGGVKGWWVDNVTVTTCKALAAGTMTATHTPEPSTFGTASAVNVKVAGSAGTATDGTVTVSEGGSVLGSAPVGATGTASVPLPATLAVGAHALTATYSGGTAYAAPPISVLATVAAKSAVASTTTASAPSKVKRKKAFDVSATVTATGVTPAGTVQVLDGSKVIGTGTLAGGKVTINIAKGLKKKGKTTLTVKYLGSADTQASQTTVKVKVKQHQRNRRR